MNEIRCLAATVAVGAVPRLGVVVTTIKAIHAM